ncbi:MAG: DNA polymerase III subunit beta [Limisphaerales bacterium]
MKLSIAKEQLIAGLQAVQNVVSTRTTLPILSNVHVRAEDNRLYLTATDLDVTVACGVEAQISSPGTTTIPVKRLFSIVRELPVGEVELDTDDKNITKLSAGASFYKLHGLSAEEFPPVPKFKETGSVTLPQDKMRALLKKTSIAISTDESRYVLNGVFMKFTPEKLVMVSTDGRRLALTEEDLPAGSTAAGDIIVPTKAVNELNRLLQTKGEVEIRFTDNQVSFRLKDETPFSVLLISKLVEGNYPNYQQVIPKEAKERITLMREEFLGALRRAELMTNDKSNSVKLAFTKNNLTITANTADVGEARESIAINYKGKDISIAFNPGYLMDPLKVVETDEIFLELSDELSPGSVKVNTPFHYVLMPMRMT